MVHIRGILYVLFVARRAAMTPRTAGALALALLGAPAVRGGRPQPQWIHGAMLPAAAGATVCSTSNGCTPGAFLACADASQNITDITFARSD